MAYHEEDLHLEATELRLGLPGRTNEPAEKQPSPSSSSSKGTKRTSDSSLQSPPKAQIVGWPPIRSHRKNIRELTSGVFVKVSMDGAPFLRKIDLNIYKGYTELLEALGEMFKCGDTIDNGGSDHRYAATYEDKDGDWMLAGDVPWHMFVSSCKRLRIMRAA